MEETKACVKCGKKYPATAEYFTRNKSGKNGIENTCKECRNIQRKIYQKTNREKTAKRMKAYQAANKEAIIRQRKLYREANKEKIKKQVSAYRTAHKDAIAKQVRAYHEANKETIAKCKKANQRANRIQINIKTKERYTLMRKLPHTLTTAQWQDTKEYFNNKCAYCGEEKPLTQDHLYPLSLGGEYSISNIVCACAQCNSSKGAKLFVTWYPAQEFYSQSRENKILSFFNYKNSTQQLALV